jgi:hypothetical protein
LLMAVNADEEFQRLLITELTAFWSEVTEERRKRKGK